MFFKRAHKLKQCKNLILHDETTHLSLSPYLSQKTADILQQYLAISTLSLLWANKIKSIGTAIA